MKAILYDLDGVLCDACEWHYISLNKALLKISNQTINRTEHETIFNGIPTKKKLEILLSQGRVKEADIPLIWQAKQDLTIQTIIENAKPDQEKIELHKYTNSLGLTSVCVTNSITETATMMLEKTGQLPFLRFIISNEMIRYPKPHGEGYIRAMIRLGAMPDECIIVEDSEKGLKAAATTGCNVIAVVGPNEVPMKVRDFLKQ